MRLFAAQTRPFPGDIEKNLEKHAQWVRAAAEFSADFILFPELSLTGYEPALASGLAVSSDDNGPEILRQFSNQYRMTLCAGMPVRENGALFIGLLIFRPAQPTQCYLKQHLYPGEEAYFSQGKQAVFLKTKENHIIAPAICYELSVPGHAENAHRNGADIYAASVLNSSGGIDHDLERLGKISSQYRMHTLMANYVGPSGGYECAGKSSVWDRTGKRLGQLDSFHEGLIGMNTESGEVFERALSPE